MTGNKPAANPTDSILFCIGFIRCPYSKAFFPHELLYRQRLNVLIWETPGEKPPCNSCPLAGICRHLHLPSHPSCIGCRTLADRIEQKRVLTYPTHCRICRSQHFYSLVRYAGTRAKQQRGNRSNRQTDNKSPRIDPFDRAVINLHSAPFQIQERIPVLDLRKIVM